MKLSPYSRLTTEKSNPRSVHLDRLSTIGVVTLMNREDARVLAAVRRARAGIAAVAEWLADALRQNKRLVLFGAGTSGRLAVLEAAECPPTFGTRSNQIVAVMAGGRSSVFRSREGAEDSAAEASRAARHWVRKGDLVIGIAASGITAFARVALEQSRRQGARTVLLTCNAPRRTSRFIHRTLVLATGPEVLSGSTRLKAGSACKMALNMITTAAMVKLGKVYGNRMVDLQPKSNKLVARGLRLVAELGKVSPGTAQQLFQQANRQVKTAIVMARLHTDAARARKRLRQAQGVLRKAVAS